MSQQRQTSERLLELARRGHDPSDADMRRVRARLHVRYLAAPIPAGTTAAHGFKAATKLALSKVLIPMSMGIGIGVAATVGAPYLLRQATIPRASVVGSAVAQTAKAAVATVRGQVPLPQHAPEPSNARSGSPSGPIPLAPQQSAPSLAPLSPLSHEEMQVELDGLRGAQRLLYGGQPAKSLEALDELARVVPSGRLMEERAAVRAMARCGLGTQGRSGAEPFFAQYPNSVHTMSVRSACSSASFDLSPGNKTEFEPPEH